MNASQPKLLYVLHSYHNKGGVEEATKMLSSALSTRFEISFVYPQGGFLVLRNSQGQDSYFPGTPLSILAPHRDTVCEQSLASILKAVRPDLIHLMHYVGWPLSIFEQLLATELPLIMSHHDYFSITPHYTMPGEPHSDATLSPEYATQMFSRDISQYLKQRRKLLLEQLSRIDAHVVPSEYLEQALSVVFPLSFSCIEYGIIPFEIKKKVKSEVSRFGYLGTLLPQKGWRVAYDAFVQAGARLQGAELHLYGSCPEGIPGSVPEGVFFHGGYDREQFPELFSKLDCGIIPSVFPETFCIVLSEMWHAGLPVLASNIGAMSSRMAGGKGGKLFEPGNVEELAASMVEFVEGAKLIPSPEVPTAEQMAAAYEEVYRGLL